MPTYDYRCGACAHTFEHRQSMSSNRLRKCPECTERKLERLIGGGAGVIFKGSGFYQTDYKNNGRGGKAGSKREEKAPEPPASCEPTNCPKADSCAEANSKKDG